jgi:hypothetical protein
LGNPGADEKIIIRWIFMNCEVVLWTGLIWLRIGTVVLELVNAVMKHRVT